MMIFSVNKTFIGFVPLKVFSLVIGYSMTNKPIIQPITYITISEGRSVRMQI